MTAPGAEVLSADSVELVCWKTVLKLLWGKHCVHTAIQNTVFNTVIVGHRPKHAVKSVHGVCF